MGDFFNDFRIEISQYYENIVILTPKLLITLLVLILTWFISKKIRIFFNKKLKERMEDLLLADFLSTVIRTTIFIVGLLISFQILGLGGIATSLLAGAGISAFIIGFALRDIGENFLAGILMAFKRPFRVGDFVETGSIKGKVQSLSIRETHIKTPDGKDVYIPNASIIKNPLSNYTIDGFLRYDIIVTLPESVDFNSYKNSIKSAVENVEGVLKNRREVNIYISGNPPGKFEVTVSFWIDTFSINDDAENIKSNVILVVQNLLNHNL